MELIRNQIYTFDIVRVDKENKFTILKGPNNSTHYFPHIVKVKRKIELKVLKKIDGKYYFSIEPELNNSYKINQSYKFKILGVVDDEKNRSGIGKLIEIEDNLGIVHTVIPFNWQLSDKYHMPSYLRCRVNDIKNNTLYLEQEVSDNIEHPLFNIGEIYSFQLEELINLKESSINLLKVKGIDGVSYIVKAHFYQYDEKQIEKEVICEYLGLDEKGKVLLEQTKSEFIKFEEIYGEKVKEDFLFNKIKGCQDSIKNKLFKDYQNKENIWVFSFCEALESLVFENLESYNYDNAKLYLEYLKIAEEWILSSGFLKTFSPENRAVNKKVAENKILRIGLINHSIHLVENYKAKEYLNNLFKKIDKTTDYEDIKEEISIAYYLFYITDNNVIKNIQLSNLVCSLGKNNLLKKSFFEWFKKLIDVRLYKIRRDIYIKEIASYEKNSDDDNELYINVCVLTYTLSFLHQLYSENDKYQIDIATFYRYVSRLHKDEYAIKAYLAYSFLRLIYGSDRITPFETFKWEDIYEGKIVNEIKQKSNLVKREVESINLDSWTDLKEKFNQKEVIKVKVIEINYSYLSIEYNGVYGIIPYNSISRFISDKDFSQNNFEVKVIKLFPELSIFIALDAFHINDQNNHWEKIFTSTKPAIDNINRYSKGDIIYRVVKNLDAEIGAFVNLGVIDGLIPKSQISWERSPELSDHFNVGETVKCSILDINTQTPSVTLSTKLLKPEPWKTVPQELKENNYFIAKLVNIKDFGLFLDIKPRLTGLLHYSKLDERSTINFKIGNFYVVQVEKFDIEEEKISFKSIRRICESDVDSEKIVNLSYEKFFKRNIIEEQTSINDNVNFKQKRDFQKAFCLKNLAIIESSITKKIDYLKLAVVLFSSNQSKHSYLTNAQVEYFDTINIFKNKNVIQDGFNEANSLVEKLNTNKKLIDSFPEVKLLIISLEILAFFGDVSKSAVDKLLGKAYKDEFNIKQKRLAKLVLSNNLILSEKIDEGFIEENKRRIVKYLKEGVLELNEIVDNESSVNINPEINELKSLINQGEGKSLEFKSTLKEPIPNEIQKEQIERLLDDIEYFKKKNNLKAVEAKEKKLLEVRNSVSSLKIKHASMKSLASFANTNGGVLLIGVEDNKNILGLKFDFQFFNGNDKYDDFKKLLDDTIRDFIGNDFHGLISTSFIEINDKSVFKVDVRKSNDPIFLKKNDNGNSTRDFYIRGEASARKLEVDEFYNYSKNRF